MERNIVQICDEIKNNSKCTSCGGSFDNSTCMYCGNKNTTLENLIGELKNEISIRQVNDDILNSLYSIRNLEINEVNNIIIENNYGKKLENKYKDIHSRITSDNLSNDDYKYIVYFLDNDLFLGKNSNYYINTLMKKMLTDKLDISNEEKLKLIKSFTEMFMRGKVKNPKCVYDELDEKTIGESLYNRIELDKTSIIEFLQNKNYIKMLEIIFHECTHTYQTHIRSVDKEISYIILQETKEYLIRQKNPKYYNENYIKYTEEAEARYCGALFTLQYLDAIGLKVSNNNYFMEVMEREEKLFYDNERTIKGKSTTIDEAFSTYVTDVSLLNHYPVLKTEYKNHNGVLTKKSMEEIIEDYNNYKNGTLVIEGNPTAIEGLYTCLLGETKGISK